MTDHKESGRKWPWKILSTCDDVSVFPGLLTDAGGYNRDAIERSISVVENLIR